MSKTTFYFVIAVLVLTDIVQSRYRLKILAEQKAGRTSDCQGEKRQEIGFCVLALPKTGVHLLAQK